MQYYIQMSNGSNQHMYSLSIRINMLTFSMIPHFNTA